MIVITSVGKRIKSVRAELGLDQKEFAQLIKATVSALSNWENGRNKPNDIMLHRIAKEGNVSVSYLLSGYKDDIDERLDNMSVRELKHYAMLYLESLGNDSE